VRVSQPWRRELWRAFGLALLLLSIGVVLGKVAWVMIIGLAVYLGWHLRALYRLESWLAKGGSAAPPEGEGIWGEVFHHLYRAQQRDRRRKRKLKNLLKRFEEATAAMPDGTVVLSPQGEIEYLNDAATRLLGVRHPQDVGRRIANLVRHPAFTNYMARADYSEAAQFPSPVDEQVMLRVRIVPYGKAQRLLVVRDVTQVYRLEAMRRDFVANVSHELRTPLTVVGGYLETLADADDPCAREWGRSLNLMQQQTARMQRIVEDLLLLARLETDTRGGAREPVSVPAMLAAIREDAVALSGEHRHNIRLDADPVLWIQGSDGELRSAFSNLVFNAVKYTPSGGDIDIRWFEDEKGAHLEVSDTGVGIEPHHIPRLTERFFRVDVARSRASGGTGLGLAIVKHVLNRHEGSLHIESEPGRGSTFSCDFPPNIVVHAATERAERI
jgi:two-component system phosphate regulon sensor histidine kinase PhoR